MKRIRVSALAEQDLDGIWYYAAKNSGSIDIADRIIDSIAAAFSLFARVPEAGTARDEIDPGVRGFPVGSYIIYYRVIGSYIVISRVIHGMRDQMTSYLHE